MRWFGSGKQCCEKSCNFSSPPTYYCERICVLCICVLYKSKSNWISQYICSQIAVIHCGREGSRSRSSVKLRNVCLPVNLKGAQTPACLPALNANSPRWTTESFKFIDDELKQYFSCISNSFSTRGAFYNWHSYRNDDMSSSCRCRQPCLPRKAYQLPSAIFYIIDTLCGTRPARKKLMCFSCVYKINKRASIKIFLVRNNFANSYTISIDSSHRVAQRVCQCHLMEITRLCKYALNSEFMQIKIMSLLSSNK